MAVTLDLPAHVEHFRWRVLQDALSEATAAYWIQRAQQFEDAAPRPGDYHGHATRAELSESWQRCQATALACRQHAELLCGLRPEPISDDVRHVLAEVA